MEVQKSTHITTVPISEIIPYKNNPRKNNKAVEIVAKSIKEFGFRNPIILGKNNVIIAGHTRLLAAQKLNLTEVPVIWADDLTQEQVKAFRIMDNKSAEYSEWDFDQLRAEMMELKSSHFDLTLTGFDKMPELYQKEQETGENVKKLGRLEITCPKCGNIFKKTEVK